MCTGTVRSYRDHGWKSDDQGKPRTEEQREMSKLCVQSIGYQGNNLLCSNWNLDNLDALDYNGLYEYLYRMKYGERFPSEKYQEGIPKEEFESLIMEYLPVSVEILQKYAEFDEKVNSYKWAPLGCGNYDPNFLELLCQRWWK